MNILVLAGGLSAERDVSLTTGTMVAQALRRQGHKTFLIDLFFGYTGDLSDPKALFSDTAAQDMAGIGTDVPDLEALLKSRADKSRIGPGVMELAKAADIVFLGLHGEDGENGTVQAAFDLHGVRYTGSPYLGSALAMNKALAKTLFQRDGIPTPRGVNVTKESRALAKDVGLPCVVKPCSGGSSVGTSIVESAAALESALDLAFRYGEEVLVEQYIKGRECDVGVLDGKALPVIEICPKTGFYDYKNKYQSGMTDEYCPADLPAETTAALQRAAEQVYRSLQLSVYARMDFIVEEGSGKVYCLEANTLPGMTGLSLLPQEAQAAGVGYDQLCEKIVKLSMEKYGL